MLANIRDLLLDKNIEISCLNAIEIYYNLERDNHIFFGIRPKKTVCYSLYINNAPETPSNSVEKVKEKKIGNWRVAVAAADDCVNNEMMGFSPSLISRLRFHVYTIHVHLLLLPPSRLR